MQRMILAIAFIIGFAAPGRAERVCAEMAGGVCLKYRNAPTARAAAPSPEAEAERRLGLGREDRRAIQRGLAAAGHYGGVIDGALGPASRRAVRAWQRAGGRPASGYLTAGDVAALSAGAAPGGEARAAGYVQRFRDRLVGVECRHVNGRGHPFRVRFKSATKVALLNLEIRNYNKVVPWRISDKGRFCIQTPSRSFCANFDEKDAEGWLGRARAEGRCDISTFKY